MGAVSADLVGFCRSFRNLLVEEFRFFSQSFLQTGSMIADLNTAGKEWYQTIQCNCKKSHKINNLNIMFCFAFIVALLEAHKSLQTIRKKRIIFSSSTKRRSASSICSKSTVFPCRRVSGSVYFVAGPHRGTAQRSFKS